MENTISFKPSQDKKLIDRVREVLRYYNYSYKTEHSYCNRIVRFIKFHGGKTHPRKLSKTEIESYLRLMECIRLRVKDIDFGQKQIYVRGGKGGKDRTTLLPDTCNDLHQRKICLIS